MFKLEHQIFNKLIQFYKIKSLKIKAIKKLKNTSDTQFKR